MINKIEHPLQTNGKLYPIHVVLMDLASQENCDGEPYDQMVIASDYIKFLEKENDRLEDEINELSWIIHNFKV